MLWRPCWRQGVTSRYGSASQSSLKTTLSAPTAGRPDATSVSGHVEIQILVIPTRGFSPTIQPAVGWQTAIGHQKHTDNTHQSSGGEWFRNLVLLAELKRKQVIDAPTNHIQLALRASVVPILAELSSNQVESIPSCKCRSLANAPSLFFFARKQWPRPKKALADG